MNDKNEYFNSKFCIILVKSAKSVQNCLKSVIKSEVFKKKYKLFNKTTMLKISCNFTDTQCKFADKI